MHGLTRAAPIQAGISGAPNDAIPARLAQALAQAAGAIATFEPHDLTGLGKAFDGAVAIASDEDGPFAVLSVHELRRRIASAILEAAYHGVRDVDLLRAHALRTVAAGLQPVRSPAATTDPRQVIARR